MSEWLIDTLLYTGVLIGLVLVLRRPVNRYFGPQFAYALWALPFLRLLLPPIVLPASFAPTSEVTPQGQLAPALPLTHADSTAESAALAAPIVPAPTALCEWNDIMAIAASLWAGVALAFVLWRVVTYRQMRRELLAQARPVGEIGKVRLVETPAIAAPVAFGVLDKVIALPPLFMAQRDLAARDLAIEHEFAHHRGHDLLANMAAQALLALHWFNPLAWYGWRAMRRDQEAACDARVLAGRGREDCIRYAALIAGVATGPRPIAFKGALAAPMACPVLGERSIVHRLRSLSMSELSRRRRLLGRTLLGASVLALPLTASISYAAASAQPAPPAPPAPPVAEFAPAPPAPPQAPAFNDGEEPGVRTFVIHREGPDREPLVSHFTSARDGAAPMPPSPPSPPSPPTPPMPRFTSHAGADPVGPEFTARMETFEREMEAWSREMEAWGETFGEQFAAQAEARALAWSDAARRAPEVVESCDRNERRRATTADGRPRIVICEREIEAQAHAGAMAGLRSARASIAGNRQISQELRREILDELDDEIAQLEREVR